MGEIDSVNLLPVLRHRCVSFRLISGRSSISECKLATVLHVIGVDFSPQYLSLSLTSKGDALRMSSVIGTLH